MFECHSPNDLANEKVYQQRDDSSVFKKLLKIVWTPNNSLLYQNAAAVTLFNINILNVVMNVEIIVVTVVLEII